MKKATKTKGITSLSNSGIENIAGRVLTDKEKDAEKKKKDALALTEHAQLEEKATAFASEFRTINKETNEAKSRLVSVLQTGRSFIESNRAFLQEVGEFFAHEKARKVKRTLNGHLTFKTWSLDLLGVTDHYVRAVFRASDSKAFKFEDGTKLLEAKNGGEGGGDEDDNEGDEKPAVSQVTFGNQLGMSTVKTVSESTYSRKEKIAILLQVSRQLVAYGEELKQEAADDSLKAEVPSDLNVETGTEAQVPA